MNSFLIGRTRHQLPASGFRPVVVQRNDADVLKSGDRVCISNDRNHLAFMTVFIDGDRVCISKDSSHLVFMTIFIDGDRVCISKDSSHLVFMTVFIDATSSCCSGAALVDQQPVV